MLQNQRHGPTIDDEMETKDSEGVAKVDPKRRHRAKPWRAAFLEAFRKTGIVTVAAKAAGVKRQTVSMAMVRNPEFKAEVDAAGEEASDYLEAVAVQRATREADPSDTLLIFLLKGRRPAKFRDNYRLEHTGADGAPIVPAVSAQGAVILLPQDRFFELAEKYWTPDGKTENGK